MSRYQARAEGANPLRLGRSDQGPRYARLASMLSGRVDSGEFQPGSRLPSEHDLIRDYGVSRTTAIAALDALVHAHVAYRVQGKGTFVGKTLISRFSLSSSFTADMLRRGLKPSSRVVAFDQTPIDPETAEQLSAPPGETWHRLVRLRLADDEPVAFQSAFLPISIFPTFHDHDFEQNSLFDIMGRLYGVRPQWAEAIVEARLPTDEEARHLGIARSAPVLLVWHLAMDETFRSVEYVRSAYRADRFSFGSGRQPVGDV